MYFNLEMLKRTSRKYAGNQSPARGQANEAGNAKGVPDKKARVPLDEENVHQSLL